MKFNPPLQKATLIKRYKRFLADVILVDGSKATIHVANTGAMTGCAEPGNTVFYSTSDNPKRKYQFSWELTQTKENHMICVNTIRANQFVEEAIKSDVIKELTGYNTLKREVKYGSENSKIDFLLTDGEQPDVYVEVKSATLLDNGQGYFPDAVTVRGQKHVRELIDVAQTGNRAVLLFAVLHSAIGTVKVAKHIDPLYADLIRQACDAGVEIIAYQANFSNSEVCLQQSIDFIND